MKVEESSARPIVDSTARLDEVRRARTCGRNASNKGRLQVRPLCDDEGVRAHYSCLLSIRDEGPREGTKTASTNTSSRAKSAPRRNLARGERAAVPGRRQ